MIQKTWRKITAITVIISFSALEIGLSQPLPSREILQGVHPEKTVAETPELSSEGEDGFFAPGSLDFLENNSPLAEVTAPASASAGALSDSPAGEAEVKTLASQFSFPHEVRPERMRFEDALEELRPEYAAAVIVEALTEDHLMRLLELPIETAVLVIYGEIVIVTSGSEDEIGVIPAVRQLIEGASFISHMHPGIYSAEGPSGHDINEAVGSQREEFVVTSQGVYAYNNEGVLNDGNFFRYDRYLEQLNQALETSLDERGQVGTRKNLNQFIAAQDWYNQANEEERVTLRRGGTLAYTSGLTSASVTALPGLPYPTLAVGSSAATRLSVSSNQFALGYSVPGASNISGFTISFDNGSTPAIETQNLSTQTYLTFGLKGPNTSVKLEVMDIHGVKDTFTLTNVVNTAERFWRIPVSSILNTLDKTRIKQLNFIVTQANTTSTTRSGTLYIRSSGLNTNAPAVPGVSTIPPAVKTTTYVLSGTKEANTAILIGGVQVVAINSATTWSATVPLAVEGNNTFSITAKNTIGKVSTAVSAVVKKDTIAPTGSLNINGGALYALSQAVTLNLSSSVGVNLADSMSFSTDNLTWTTPEVYADSRIFTLPAGDGSKTVYVKYFDKAGNGSPVYSKSIILDTMAPTGTVSVNVGATAVKQTAVTLNLTAADAGSGRDKMSFSSDNVTWTPAETFAATKAWSFSTGDGNKTVYVKLLDKAGNWSIPLSVSVVLDTVIPTGTIHINGGDDFTKATAVTLNLSAADGGSGIDKMSFSSDNVAWTAAETFAVSRAWSLTAGDGSKTVYVKYYDKAGNISAVTSKGITLDTVTPTGSFAISGGAAYTNSSSITTSLSVADNGSGIDLIRFSVDGGQVWAAWETYVTSKVLTLPAGDGNKSLQCQIRDRAGNIAVLTTAVGLDTTPLTGSMKINADAYTVNQTRVTLSLTANDSFSGIGQMHFTSDGANGIWTDWEDFQAGKIWTLSSGDGLKQVFWQISDKAWNLTSGSDSILLDRVAPTGTITINSGAAYSTSTTVTLNLAGLDVGSGLDTMSFSTDNTTWTAPEVYGALKSFTLSSGDGNKMVFVRYGDKAGNTSIAYTKTITLDTIPPEFILTNSVAVRTRDANLTIQYTADGAAKEKSYQLQEGQNTLVISEKDAAGNETIQSFQIELDTTPPVIHFNAPKRVETSPLVIHYMSEGQSREKILTFEGAPGPRQFEILEADDLGNENHLTFSIDFDPPNFTRTLNDQTILRYENRILRHEILPSGDQIFYSVNGRIESYQNASGPQIRYWDDPQDPRIERVVNGLTTETLRLSEPLFFDEQTLIRTTLENGAVVFYQSGVPVFMKLTNAVRVYNFKTAADGSITDALLVYPDGRLEIIRNGVVLRSQSVEGLIMDYLPDGRLVREISVNGTGWYTYEKDQSARVVKTQMSFNSTESVTYGADGLLIQIKKGNKEFNYGRYETENTMGVLLEGLVQSDVLERVPVEFAYTKAGKLQSIHYSDHSRAVFENGLLKRYVDAQGYEADYHTVMKDDLIQGVAVQRGGAELAYDEKGTLTEIKSDLGTLIRAKQTGATATEMLRGEDVVNILLETVEGDQLSEFELDSEGRILKGILETKEGIKQTIENGVLTGFETVDGKIYGIRNNEGASEAYLKEWHFQDGSRVLYGLSAGQASGGTIEQILLADGRRLDAIGLNAMRQVSAFTETLADGTQKDFENGQLRRLRLPQGGEIRYGLEGSIESVKLADGEEQTVSYTKDENGEIEKITFDGPSARRVFLADGTLKEVLTDGVQAELENGKIQKLFTRFGEIDNPVFDASGKVSGNIRFTDGSHQQVGKGVLTKTVLPNGWVLTYDGGNLKSIHTGQALYTLIDKTGADGTTDQLIRIETSLGIKEYPFPAYFEDPDYYRSLEFRDFSASENITYAGDAAVDKTKSAVGNGSAVLDGSGDSMIFGEDPSFDFGSGNFTIESWVNFEEVNGAFTIAQKYSGGTGWIFIADPWSKQMILYDSGWTRVMATAEFERDRWYHLAVVRSGNVIQFFKDGVQMGSDIAIASSRVFSGPNIPLKLGLYETNISAMNGWLDEVRISKGIARWTSNFIPSTERYSVDGQTKLLLHFDSRVDSGTAEDSQAAALFFARPLDNILDNRADALSWFENEQALHFKSTVTDADRGKVHTFGGQYDPAWQGVVTGDSYLNSGYISNNVRLQIPDSLPSLTATFMDINGDGLADRIYADSDLTNNFWWVQINNGSGFDTSVKWTGMDRTFDQLEYGSFYQNLGMIQFYYGRVPFRLGDLVDLDGDGLPDRVLVKKDPSPDWYVQWNNGHGFDAPVVWTSNVQAASSWYMYSKYAIEMRGEQKETPVEEIFADLVDMDGDGLPDRIVEPLVPDGGKYDHWFFQKNLGRDKGFADAVLWPGVDSSFHSNPQLGGSISWYNSDWASHDLMTDLSQLIDMNGDGLPDRVLLKPADPLIVESALDWYVQINSGAGFDAPVLWDSSVRTEAAAGTARLGTAIHAISRVWWGRQVIEDLQDVTGDRLPDRITVDKNSSGVGYSWYVEVNNGETFLPAVEWKGIDGNTLQTAAITQDNENFRMNAGAGSTIADGALPYYVQETVELKDINGDGIPDRVLTAANQTRWRVQFGTGSGFLSAQSLRIASLGADTDSIDTTRYDTLYVPLKASKAFSAAQGTIKVELLGKSGETLQSWTINSLSAEWNDFYLPLDSAKPASAQIKMTFVRAAGAPEITISAAEITFMALRPDASKDWLDRFLAEENILAEVQSSRAEVLADYLHFETGLTHNQPDWDKFLQAETRIDFNADGAAQSFQTLYGTVSKVQAGRVVESIQPDGSKIEFGALAAGTSTVSHTTTAADGTTQTMQLSYDRVRTVTDSSGGVIQYSYEFQDDGAEITIVTEPASGHVERYLNKRLISSIEANGVETRFHYNGHGELEKSEVVYKDRVQQTFQHKTLDNGYQTVLTEDGTLEEYDASGRIVGSQTAQGYHYAHSYATAQKVVTSTRTENITLADGSLLKVDIPVVTLLDDPQGERVHRVNLDSYTDTDGVKAEYQDVAIAAFQNQEMQGAGFAPYALKTLTLADKTKIFFNTVSLSSAEESERATYAPQEATVFFDDGTVTEFKSGQPSAVISALGRSISLAADADGILLNPAESAVFHLQQAQKLWQEKVIPGWQKYTLAAAQTVESEYTPDGKLVTHTYAEGVTEIYGVDGKIEGTLAPDGETLVTYSYDSDSNPIAITELGSRRRLNSQVLALKAQVAMQREEALAHVAVRQQVLHETTESDYRAARDWLLTIRAQIEAQKDKVTLVRVQGKKSKELLGEAMAQIQVGVDQVNQVLSDLATRRSQALEELASQVQSTNAEIETQTAQAYAQIADEQTRLSRSIHKAEVTPVIHHWYRKILGRDPSQSEDDFWVNSSFSSPGYGGGQAGETAPCHSRESGNPCRVPAWLDDLIQQLKTSAELVSRTSEVSAIKARLANQLNQYAALSEVDKKAFAAVLGISISPSLLGEGELVSLSSVEIQSILNWINRQSLHFGQSAYIALEALLKQAGYEQKPCEFSISGEGSSSSSVYGEGQEGDGLDAVCSVPSSFYYTNGSQTFSRIQLATELILADILTGTLTPFETGDLVISLYAMKRFAARYGLNADGYSLDYTALLTLFSSPAYGGGQAGGDPQATIHNFRVIAHINGNHYVMITNVTDTEVSYIDPGIGSEDALQATTLTKDEFIKVWLNSAVSGSRQGVIFTANSSSPVLVGGGQEGEYLEPGTSSVSGFVNTFHGSRLTIQETMRVRGAFFGFIGTIFKALFHLVVDAVKAVVNAVKTLLIAIYESTKAFYVGLYNFFAGLVTLDFSRMGRGLKQAFIESNQIAVTGIKESIFELGQPSLNLLRNLGVSEKTIRRIEKVRQYAWDGVEIAVGVVLIATGNVPQGIAFIASGTANLLNKHTKLSPTVKSVITLSAAAVAAFGAGYVDGVSVSAGLESLKAAAPTLSQEFAAAGISVVGSQIGLDPRLTAVLSIPVQASVGRVTAGQAAGSRASILNTLKNNFLKDSLSGIVSLGTNIALDKLGVPQSASAFLNQYLGQVFSGGANSSGGITSAGQSAVDKVFSSLSAGIQKFSSAAKTLTGNVLSFGQKVLQQTGQFSAAAFKKTLGTVSNLFDRQTQEAIYQDLAGIRQGTVTETPDYWIWQSGQDIVYYDLNTHQLIQYTPDIRMRVDDLHMNDEGIYEHKSLTYSEVTLEGYEIQQRYEYGDIKEASVYYKDTSILEILAKDESENTHTFEGFIRNSEVSLPTPIYIPVSATESNAPPFVVPSRLYLTVQNEKLVDGRVELDKSIGDDRKDKTLYVLVNGVLNENTTFDGAPEYLKNLETDIVGRSSSKVSYSDIIKAPTFFAGARLLQLQFGDMRIDLEDSVNAALKLTAGLSSALWLLAADAVQNIVLNLGKDLVDWIVEVSDPAAQAQLSQEIQVSVDSYLNFYGRESRARTTVAVGYSGGFVPMVETLARQAYDSETQTGFNVKTLVALGAVTLNPEQAMKDLLVKIAEASEKLSEAGRINEEVAKTALKSLDNALLSGAGFGFGVSAMNRILSFLDQKMPDQAYREYQAQIKILADQLDAMFKGFALASLEGSAVEMIVNIYGTIDFVTELGVNGTKLGGHRSEMAGFTPTSQTKTLFNIEIVGAEHYDYMRRNDDLLNQVLNLADSEADVWNKTVSAFVADIILNANDPDKLENFLIEQKDQSFAEKVGDCWVVTLPGAKARG